MSPFCQPYPQPAQHLYERTGEWCADFTAAQAILFILIVIVAIFVVFHKWIWRLRTADLLFRLSGATASPSGHLRSLRRVRSPQSVRVDHPVCGNKSEYVALPAWWACAVDGRRARHR